MTETTTPSSSEQVKLLTAEDFEALCSPDLQQTLRDTASPTLSPNQQLLLALTARTYKRYQDSESTGAISLVFLSVVSFLFAALVTFGMFWLLNWFLPDSWLLYTVAILALGTVLGYWLSINSSEISFCRISGGRLDAFKLGRMENIFDKDTLGASFMAFGLTLASHIALLNMTSAHMGIAHVNGLLDSLLIATDNLCRGVLLDVLEIYELRIGKVTGSLSFWIATLFFCFRVMYGWLFISILVWTWRRIRAGKLLREFPQQINAQNMSDWMHTMSNHPARLGPVLHNELVFNFLAEEYIRGNFEVVQTASEQFSKLSVVDEVRALFVHPDSGECLFPDLVEGE